MSLNWTDKWTMKFRTKINIFLHYESALALGPLLLIGVKDPDYSYCDFFFIGSLSRCGCGMGYGIHATWKCKLWNRILYLFLIILVIAWSTFPPLQLAVTFYDFLFCIAIGNSLETSLSPHFFDQMLVFGYLEKYDFYSVIVRCTCPGVIENQDFVLNTP